MLQCSFQMWPQFQVMKSMYIKKNNQASQKLRIQTSCFSMFFLLLCQAGSFTPVESKYCPFDECVLRFLHNSLLEEYYRPIVPYTPPCINEHLTISSAICLC